MSDADEHTRNQKSELSFVEDEPAQKGFETISYTKNEVIFEEGDAGLAAFLIVKGTVEIRKGMTTSNPQTLAKLQKNDIFGEMALFDDRPRMAEAIARTEVEVVAIKHDEFNRRLDAMDPVLKSMTIYLVQRVRAMSSEFMRRKDPSWGEWKKD